MAEVVALALGLPEWFWWLVVALGAAGLAYVVWCWKE